MDTYINKGNHAFRDVVVYEYVDKAFLIPLVAPIRQVNGEDGSLFGRNAPCGCQFRSSYESSRHTCQTAHFREKQ